MATLQKLVDTNRQASATEHEKGTYFEVPDAPIEISIIHDINAVIPAKAGIQQDKNALCLNPLVSRFRENDVPVFYFLSPVTNDAVLSSIMENSIICATKPLTTICTARYKRMPTGHVSRAWMRATTAPCV